jgi:protein SCO1/2
MTTIHGRTAGGGSFGERRRKTVSVLLAVAGLAVATGALGQAATGASGHDHQHHDHGAMKPAAFKRSEVNYSVPAITMDRQDGRKATFPDELDDGRAVLLQFVYTSCTTICPVMAQVFAEVQGKLGKDAPKVHMVSVSIDPEHDTVARIDAYAKKLGAGSQWQFYTGTQKSSIALQKAFDAYRGDKMNHVPTTYLRAAPGKPWVRLDGLGGPDDIVTEYRRVASKG